MTTQEKLDLIWYLFLELCDKYNKLTDEGFQTLCGMKVDEGWDFTKGAHYVNKIIQELEERL